MKAIKNKTINGKKISYSVFYSKSKDFGKEESHYEGYSIREVKFEVEGKEYLTELKTLAEESDKIEIHSLPDKWAIKQSGKINRRLIFDTEEKADAEFWILKPSHIDKPLEVVPVREFLIWYRQWDDKDFLEFYTDTPNLEDAVQEAVEHLRGHVLIDYDQKTVARYSENFIKEPEKRR